MIQKRIKPLTITWQKYGMLTIHLLFLVTDLMVLIQGVQ